MPRHFIHGKAYAYSVSKDCVPGKMGAPDEGVLQPTCGCPVWQASTITKFSVSSLRLGLLTSFL